MAYYNIVNQQDGNQSFMIEADSFDDAAHKALLELNWFVSAEPVEDEIEDDFND